MGGVVEEFDIEEENEVGSDEQDDERVGSDETIRVEFEWVEGQAEETVWSVEAENQVTEEEGIDDVTNAIVPPQLSEREAGEGD